MTADGDQPDDQANGQADDQADDLDTVRDDDGQQPSGTDEFGLPTQPSSEPAASDDRQSMDDDVDSEATGDHSRTAGADADAPLSSLASSVDERRTGAVEPAEDDLFDEEEMPEIDTDVVWERLGEDEPPELPEETEHDVRLVRKRSYCEQCPFFSEPPDVQCSHDGTEILELVDMEQFRVVNCPKVREDERLERL